MKILSEIKDKDYPEDESELENRETARAVLFDDNGLVPLLFASRYNYHKLPGGGLEEGEDKFTALARELKEEVGCTAEIIAEIGQVIEFRSKWDLKQYSSCYLAKVLSKGQHDFTDKELEEGFEIIWVKFAEAISLIENDASENYEGGFVQKRDLAILKALREMLTDNSDIRTQLKIEL